jgi:hypothetical protein
MAAAAVPVVEGAAIALLRALGIVGTGVAGVAGTKALTDAAKAKADTADKSKDLPIAQATSATQTKKKCDKCPPDNGSLVTRNWNMSDESRLYQARITGFAPRTEWSYEDCDFDGFRSAACTLLEAKARYDQFFDDDGEPEFFFRMTGARKMMAQALNQSDIIWASPPAQLQWHFMQPVSYAYFKAKFNGDLLPILTFNTP